MAVVLTAGWCVNCVHPALAQQEREPATFGTIVGQMQAPDMQYALSVFLEERRERKNKVEGALVLTWFDARFEAQTEFRRGDFRYDEGRNIVGACLEGRSEVASFDGGVERQVQTQFCISGGAYEVVFIFRDGTRLADAGSIDVGGNRFFDGFRPAGLIGGVGESTDRSGDTVRLATGFALADDGAVVGGVAATMFNPTEFRLTKINADLDNAEVRLSRRGDVDAVLLEGVAVVEHDGETCVGGLSSLVDVGSGVTSLAIPSCGVEGESQANRRYLYFAKVAN